MNFTGILLAATIASNGYAISSAISGVSMNDQWDNPWVSIDAIPGAENASVSIFDCSGKSRIIGEVPISALGSQNNFSGFKPYMNATLQDLAAVSNEVTFERNCMRESLAGQACEQNPKRYDCRVMLEPVYGGGGTIPADAWDTYRSTHHKK